MHHTHAATTTTASGFDDDGITHHFGNAANLCRVIWQFAFRTRYTRHTCFDHGLLSGHLVTHDADGLRSGADELEATLFNALGKVSVFT